jgi:DNA mismatch repair protein MutS
LISSAIVEDPPATPEQGEIIRAGYSKELDGLRALLKGSKTYLAEMERRERARTGIKSLRVSYNKVFGYYIEVTKPNLHLVPSDYLRKQTLVSAERFFTMELKEHELMISNAQERILELETSLFQQVCRRVGARRNEVLATADALAHLDVFSALAELAARHHYVRPKLDDGQRLCIKAGRHPVVEQRLEGKFVPNDIELAGGTSSRSDGAQIIILTGANMSGKSTTLRQVALIVLLAQVGAFVPAKEATISITDRIFTRVGLQDLLAQGQSSFMLEMLETAGILNNATPRSLIILDELGRGTSTYDGLSIARAIVEYLHNHPNVRAKTLFATHYHELTELAEALPRVKNFHVAVTEKDGNVEFLYKVLPGRADSSYGIHVAKLAGLPKPIIHRAREIMAEYEAGTERATRRGPDRDYPPTVHEPAAAYELSPAYAKAIEDLLKLDINTLTPVEAITKLYELQNLLAQLKVLASPPWPPNPTQ